MSFRLKTIIGIAAIEAVLLIILVWNSLSLLQTSNEEALAARAESSAKLFALTIKDATIASDLATLESSVRSFGDAPGLRYIRVIDGQGVILASHGTSDTGAKFEADADVGSVQDGVFDTAVKIVEGGVDFGRVEMGFSVETVRELVAVARQRTISIALIEMVLVALFSLALGIYLTRQLTSLKTGAAKISEGELGYQIPVAGRDELGQTAETFNAMSKQLAVLYEAEAAQKESLAQSEARLRNVIESSIQGILIHQEGRPVFANQSYAEMFGYEDVDDVLSVESFLGFVAPADREWLLDLSRRRIENETELPSIYSFQGLRKDGSKFWLENRATLTNWNDAPAVQSIVVDISDRQEAEAALKDSEERYRATVDTALDCIIIIDEDSAIIEFNPAAEECFGYKREAALGQSLTDLIIPERHRDAHRAGMNRYLDTGKANILNQRIELDAIRADGSEFPIELTVTESRSPRGPLFISYLRDISERKSAEDDLREAKERAEVASKAKSDFLAMMSHEIRTPLNGVLGMLGILNETSLTEEQKNYVRTSRDSGDALLQILNDILDFSKMEAGRLNLEVGAFDLSALASGVTELFATQTAEKNIALNLDLGDAVPATLLGDAGRLRQILVNLVGNAVKFTEQGQVALSIREVEARPDNAVRLRFEVRDTGPGVPTDQQGKLFERFTQITQDDQFHPGGTGLGLAISQRLSEMMGGEIGYFAPAKGGSVFWFELPFDVAAEELEASVSVEAKRTVERRTKARRRHSQLRILLAEDNPTNSQVAKIILEKANHAVDIVADGIEALEAAKSAPYDLILMDIGMPEMNGLDATKAIRKLSSPAAETPIIAMTAHVMKSDRSMIDDAGMDDYLSKPFSRGELLQMIDRWADAAPSVSPAPLSSNEDSIEEEDQQYIDRAAIDKLAADTDAAMIPMLLDTFLTDAQQRVEAVETAKAKNDSATLQAEAHALKSSAASFGATALSAAALDLETAAKNADHAEVTECAEKFVRIGHETVRVFKEFHATL